MAFSSIIRTLERSPLTGELLAKLNRQSSLHLNGIARLPKGLVSSAIAKASDRNLLVVCATLEEASRWAAQLEAMNWQTVHVYPTSEASPYEPFDPESEMTWGQMQVLADLVGHSSISDLGDSGENHAVTVNGLAIIATHAALQPHLPPVKAFAPYCLTINQGMTAEIKDIDNQLARLGYERVPLVEMEGQWSRRGDIVDIFPVAAELPVRLEWFGDELEQLREFDPGSQRSLDKIGQLVLTPTDFSPIITDALSDTQVQQVQIHLEEEEQALWQAGGHLEGSRRFLGMAFDQPASFLDYLPENTVFSIDETEQIRAQGDRW
ncbi:MAG: transcription-repair coupling factor, partial [Coleofasciculus sp. C2-GNP5-27]